MFKTLSLPPVLRFGVIEVRAAERRVLVDGVPATLGARSLDLLLVLLEYRERTMSKNELLDLVWPGLVVEENNLQVQISHLRKVFGAAAIATIPGRGYRFTSQPEAGVGSIAMDPSPVRAETAALPEPLLLIGRDADLAALVAEVESNALVTVVGAGGMGKTRLAQAAVARLGVTLGGLVCWVELAALSDPLLVPTTVARAVGVATHASQDVYQPMVAKLDSGSAVLVLDNCEHLSDAVAALVSELRARAPRLRILVTSQEPLRIDGEHLYRLGPLAVPAPDALTSEDVGGAMALMLARVRAVDPHFKLRPGELPVLADVCRRLDGIPLAIELAAARVPLLGLEQLHRRLDDRFRLLTAGARVVLRRHQTLRATLDWSYALLADVDRIVLRRMAIFAGSFALEAAERVGADDALDAWTVLDSLGTLVDKSLVVVTDDTPPRYRLLETTRSYGLEKLADAGETERIAERHAEAMIELLAGRAEGPQRWSQDATALATAASELDNLRAALDWADADVARLPLGVRLAGLSVRIWHVANLIHEGMGRCMALRRRLPAGTPMADEAALAFACGRLGAVTSRADVIDATRRAVELYRQLGETSRLYDALTVLVASAAERGHLDEAAAGVAEALALERPDFPPAQRGGFAWARQRWLRKTGRKEEALQAVLQQAALYREAGNVAAEMMAIGNVAHCEVTLGRFEEAERHARDALERLDAIGAQGHGGHIGWSLALALVMQVKSSEALAAAAQAWPPLRAEGDEIRLLPVAALAAAQQGRLADACRAIGCFEAAIERLDLVRPPPESGEEDALAQLIAGLSHEEATREREAGASLAVEAAFAQACGRTR
jgi:predicted ATPase/DNA-binding winged helix-turn-helix (wHTH) protein